MPPRATGPTRILEVVARHQLALAQTMLVELAQFVVGHLIQRLRRNLDGKWCVTEIRTAGQARCGTPL